MTETHTLLATFASTRSPDAFRQLVDQYIDLVYSTAARRLGRDAHAAQDAVQVVFLDLSRLAAKLPGDVQLGGWLHRHTCFVTGKMLRAENRRRTHETEAAKMNASEATEKDSFDDVAPLLDEAIEALEETDRAAIMLRFFERLDFRSIGEAIESSEDAARMRVSRAVEKLRGLLARRGVTIGAVALAALLADRTVSAAPFGSADLVTKTVATRSLARVAKIKLGAMAAGGAIAVAAGVAITLALTRQVSSAPVTPATAPATTRAATTAPAVSTFVASVKGTKGVPIKGLIVSDGVTRKVSGTLPQKFTTQGNDVRFAIQLNGKGWISIDVSENGKSLGGSGSGDTTFGGVLATFLRGPNTVNLFTTFDKDQDPAEVVKDR